MVQSNPIPKTVAEFKSDLRLMLHWRDYFERHLHSEPPRVPIAEGLVATLVRQHSMLQLGTSFQPFEQWGISFDEAVGVAKENLRERGLRFSQEGGMFSSSGKLSASQMLLTNDIHGLKVAGDPIAVPWDYNKMFLCGSLDHDSLAAVAKLVRNREYRYAKDICLPFRLVGERWELYRPAEDDESFEVLHELELQSLQQEYANQKLALDFRRESEELPFVAPYITTWHKSGRLRSWCKWPERGVALLPRTDFVSFEQSTALGSARGLGCADWATVLRLAGDLMVREAMYPERWRVNGDPSESVLEQLRCARFGR